MITFWEKATHQEGTIKTFLLCKIWYTKILLLSSFFVVFGIITISIRNSEIIADRLLNYIVCEVRGYANSNSCVAERDELKSHLQPELSSISFLLMGLVLWSNLLFAVQFTDINQILQKMKSVYQHFFSNWDVISTTHVCVKYLHSCSDVCIYISIYSWDIHN